MGEKGDGFGQAFFLRGGEKGAFDIIVSNQQGGGRKPKKQLIILKIY